MRCGTHRSLRWATVVVASALLAATGCSHGGHKAATPSVPAGVPAGAIGRSPSGVTTKVDVPANSSEDEYYQACHAAKVWMDAQPKTGQSLLEPYLAMVQASPTGTAGSWNSRWTDLTPGRQAAVIVAANAAADHECD